jgi:hypothetical protein
MKKILLLLFCVSFLGVNAQEEKTPIYMDTVDIVDVLKSIYLKESTYRKIYFESDTTILGDTSFLVENCLINFEFDITDIEGSDNNERTILSDGLISDSPYRVLKDRLKFTDSTLQLSSIGFKDCKIGRTIWNKNGKWYRWSYGISLDRINFTHSISFQNVDGIVHLNQIVTKQFVLVKTKMEIDISNSTFDRFVSLGGYTSGKRSICTGSIGIYDSKIDHISIFDFEGKIVLDSCEFLPKGVDTLRRINELEFVKIDQFNKKSDKFNLNSLAPLLKSRLYRDSLLKYGLAFNILTENEQVDLTIKNCYGSFQEMDIWIRLKGEFKSLEITDNSIDGFIDLQNSSSQKRFVFLNNSYLKGIAFNNFIFPEKGNELDWKSLNGYKIGGVGTEYLEKRHKNHEEFHPIFTGKSNSVFELTRVSNGIVRIYSEVYKILKDQGNRIEANHCYAEMKQVETRRWKYLYEQNKSFEGLFRWQLNAFLSYFTDYGTNPAKAVIKSGWVILLFAIFYLFFPSDWDVSNRSQLLSKVKDLASKNREKSFIATLAFVAYSAFIHILNTLTLSLNAFTTLGFGDIPTHGAARYVTIVQGFIGWFLLTIFSVSLINQVLG